MQYSQDISSAFKSKNPVTKARYEELTGKLLTKAIEIKSDQLEILNFSEIASKQQEINHKAYELKSKASKFYVLGTGGASLCGQAICGLKEGDDKTVKFLDNIDPRTQEYVLKRIDLSESFFIVISKSGRTIETLSQFLVMLDFCRKKVIDPKDKFLVITDLDNDKNLIRNIAHSLGVEIIAHEKVGGRFSIFTNVGLLPAALSGVGIEQFLIGAQQELSDFYRNPLESKAMEGATISHLLSENGYASTVMMPYIDRFKNFSNWWCQIWAESLGKTENVLTPIKALGTIDQHSQMQLFLQGRKDKLFTIIRSKGFCSGIEISTSGMAIDESAYLSGHDFANIIESSAAATSETMVDNNLPVRDIVIEKLDENIFGKICMQFILEVILLAKYLQINPFDQPAVEQGKKLATEKLKMSV